MLYLFEDIKNTIKDNVIAKYIRIKRANKRIVNEKSINKRINKYMGEISSEERARIKKDILDAARKYRFSAEEYFYYHLADKSDEERRTFISDLDRVEFCIKVNKAKNLDKFKDKGRTAKIFSKYYKRDVCKVESVKDLEKLKEFAKKHKKIIIKPLKGSFGAGVRVLEKEWTDDELKQIIFEYCTKEIGGFIAEELIVQVPEMAQFHPASLNTIRVATVRFDEGSEVIGAFFRTGRGESIVDNGGQGGIFGTIDVKSGVIVAVGDECGNNYTKHPDTEIDMVGFSIPRWEDAVNTAKELSLVIKDNRYTGWDLALSEKGWVLVEGNSMGQFLWQIPTRKGFRSEIDYILERLGFSKTKTH